MNLYDYRFGTIRNNTALKLASIALRLGRGFGTIRNNTALKHSFLFVFPVLMFWNHSKQHSSKTS